MKRAALGLLLIVSAGCISGKNVPLERLAGDMTERYARETPSQWSENLEGVETRMDTREKRIALTLDACGSDGDGYDRDLIEFLRAEKIPAALFINARWIDKNPAVFLELTRDPLFTIENHGTLHRPASLNGRSAYGLQGTRNAAELTLEVEANARKIEQLTGRKPLFFRSGTAYYDEAAVRLIRDLGYRIAGFDVLGDRGATYSAAEVREALLSSREGSIVILHMNHPEKETAEGLRLAVPPLKAAGFRFVSLEGLEAHEVRR